MTAVKSHQAGAFLKSPDPRLYAFLVYGSDAGLIAERGQALAAAIAKRDDGEVLRLDDSDLETDSGRLMNELGTIPMFGGRKIVRAATGRRINVQTLKPILEGPPLAGVLIVESPTVKKGDALLTLFEASPRMAAIACFADEARDLDTVVREALAAEKLTIGADARALLVGRLGADRAMTRSEIDKLVLYAHGAQEITAADVEAIVGDASELAIDRILVAVASGEPGKVAFEFSRAASSGENAQGIILATERYFQRLHRVRAALDGGKSFDDAVRSLRPPLHFKLKDAMAAQCRQWTTPRLTAALARITETARAARLAGPLEEAHAERLLLALAMLAKGRG